MSTFSIRFRPERRFAQLVRHRYDPSIKRSRALPIGSIDRRVDPDELRPGLRLNPDQSLTPEEEARLRDWLLVHGDPEAAEARRQWKLKLEREIREQVEVELGLPRNPFERAEGALLELMGWLSSLPETAPGERLARAGNLRPRYLSLLRHWDGVFEQAQKQGIAKRRPARPSQGTSASVSREVSPQSSPQNQDANADA